MSLIIEPSRAEPSRAEPSRAEPSRAEPSRAERYTYLSNPRRVGAAALLAAALFLFATVPAQAQTVWSATLTVDQFGVHFGCATGLRLSGLDDCSTALTDNDFAYGGTNYSVGDLFWQNVDNRLNLRLNTVPSTAPKTGLSGLALNVDGHRLAISAATAYDNDNDTVYWPFDPNPDWTDGQTLSVSLAPPAAAPPPSRPHRPNRHPTVTLSCAPCEVERGGEAMLTATASDPDNDRLAYAWTVSDGVITGADNTAAVRWTAPDRVGTVTIRVRVSDGRGGWESARADIEVLAVLPERTPFDVADRGTATFTTGGQADSPRAGYGLIRADGGMATPSGIALFQFRDSEGVLITEASVPAAAPVRQGRIFAEVGDSVNTAVSFANPARRPVDISFYLTDTAGTRTGEGSFTLEGLRAPDGAPERAAVRGRRRGGDLHLPGFGGGGGDRAAGGRQPGGRVAVDHAAGDAAAAGASLAAPERLDRSAGVPALRRRAGLGHPGDPGQPHPAADRGNAGVSGTGRGPAEGDAGRRPDGSELPVLDCRQQRLARGHRQLRRPHGHRLATGHARRRLDSRRGPLRPAVVLLHRRQQDRLAGGRARFALLDRLPGPDRRCRPARPARLHPYRPGPRQRRRCGNHRSAWRSPARTDRCCCLRPASRCRLEARPPACWTRSSICPRTSLPACCG